MKIRLGLIFLGDRHTPVGRGLGVWRQRRRSSADDASHVVSNGVDRTDDERLADVSDRRGDAQPQPLRLRTTSLCSTSSAAILRADLKKLETVATSAQLNAVQTLIASAAEQGQRQTGTTAINELKVQSVNLDNSDPKAGKVPTVVIDVCWDVSKVDVLDKSGKSIVSPNRPNTGWTRYTVANYDYAADPTGGWRVATGQDLKQTPCAAS